MINLIAHSFSVHIKDTERRLCLFEFRVLGIYFRLLMLFGGSGWPKEWFEFLSESFLAILYSSKASSIYQNKVSLKLHFYLYKISKIILVPRAPPLETFTNYVYQIKRMRNALRRRNWFFKLQYIFAHKKKKKHVFWSMMELVVNCERFFINENGLCVNFWFLSPSRLLL